MTVERQTMEVDIACVGFGPAMGGFLTTLSRSLVDENGQALLESGIMPGMPLQVVCYERADDISFGVSGVVTRARSIRASFPDLNPADIPLACPVSHEKVLYLLDPVGASRRSFGVRALDRLVGTLGAKDHACELPYIPPFLSKEEGLVLSIGQFTQWVGSQLMASGLVQVWPGMPVSEPLIDGNRVMGIRLADQGTNKDGSPAPGYMPGMDIRAALTVVGDGPVGPVGQTLDRHFGLPAGHHQREWAVGMKVVVELPENSRLTPGAVIHTLGYPEPEIFGFLYVYPDRVASLGIFVPSWFDSPVRTSYRYLQHWMMHPAIWPHLEGGTLRSWGAKTLQESGKRGEPFLVGDGYARIGEGSGSTNVLTGSGVDEAWATGVQLAEGVVELLKAGKPFTRENLEAAYVNRRRTSWVEQEAEAAKQARDGFQRGVFTGLFGMGLTGVSGGRLNVGSGIKRPYERIPSLNDYCRWKIAPSKLAAIRQESVTNGTSLADAVMDRLGWPQIPLDGKLLVSQQDALLLGGKVQAPAGYGDHVVILDPRLCEGCSPQLCVEICSGQAITASEGGGAPQFDREKCIHCGACMWNCTRPLSKNAERCNIEFKAGTGGLHSAEN
ncbi:MAG: electron-transferring-flavoprotein [Geobacteraceae bacterium]|nr:MAG: electron-transferring-flavoprotein [Geobacteraceae bacterium]